MITKEMIEDYINDEIDFIERYETYDDAKNDIEYLKSLTDEDLKLVEEKCNRDDELRQCINECLNYYVYHTKKSTI